MSRIGKDGAKTRSELHLVQLLPNLITLAALCSGLTGIRFAIEGRFSWAIAAIIIAAVLDGLDGRLARRLSSESAMGAELDSLGDFLNFGVAPALTLYLWGFGDLPGDGWIATLIFVVCCVLRLARFNLGKHELPSPDDPGGFVGVPSPAGAMLVMLPLFVAFMLPDAPRLPPLFLGFYLVAVGGAMISRLPTPSFKSLTIYAENARFFVVGSVALLAALIIHPWLTLVVLDGVYIAVLLRCLTRAGLQFHRSKKRINHVNPID